MNDLPDIVVKDRRMPSIFLSVVPIVLGSIALIAFTDTDFSHLIQTLASLGPLDWKSVGASLFCGGVLGWERQLRNKPIGMRTAMLVTLGTYIFVSISLYMARTMTFGDSTLVTDPSRIVGQIVSGVGFLGAGVMFTRKGSVTGVTSAATIWLLAAIGVCIGAGAIDTAIKVSMLGAVVLILVDSFDDILADATKRLFHHKSRYAGQLRRPRRRNYDE
jgi:putative Mg2+ transporter-C (MgtC) family protein